MDYKIENDEIIFNNNFNNSLKFYYDILSKYDRLWFGEKFNNSIEGLPKNIKSITFPYFGDFQQSCDNLHIGLEELKLNSNYKYSLDFLPITLKKLTFPVSQNYSYEIVNLPPNLKYLNLGYHYHKKLYVPEFLEELAIPYWYQYKWDNFPKTIKKIMIPMSPPPEEWMNNFKKFEKERKIVVNFF